MCSMGECVWVCKWIHVEGGRVYEWSVYPFSTFPWCRVRRRIIYEERIRGGLVVLTTVGGP